MKELTGKLLIASPNTDPASYFSKSVIYVIQSDVNGSIGVIVNFPFITLNGRLTVSYDSYNQENIDVQNFHTYSGGPVDIERGFVLKLQKNIKNKPKIAFDSSMASFKKLSNKGDKKKESMFVFGYCGWEPGQLEFELRNNQWLVTEADDQVIFSQKDSDKWNKALSNLNIDPLLYQASVGHC